MSHAGHRQLVSGVVAAARVGPRADDPCAGLGGAGPAHLGRGLLSLDRPGADLGIDADEAVTVFGRGRDGLGAAVVQGPPRVAQRQLLPLDRVGLGGPLLVVGGEVRLPGRGEFGPEFPGLGMTVDPHGLTLAGLDQDASGPHHDAYRGVLVSVRVPCHPAQIDGDGSGRVGPQIDGAVGQDRVGRRGGVEVLVGQDDVDRAFGDGSADGLRGQDGPEDEQRQTREEGQPAQTGHPPAATTPQSGDDDAARQQEDHAPGR